MYEDEEVKTGVEDPAAGDEEKGEQTVPISVVQALREELKEHKDELKVYRAQLYNQPQVQKEPAKSPLDSIADDEVLTGADFKRVLNQYETAFRGEISQTNVKTSHPDMEEVITKHLPNVLNKKPHLAAALKSVQDPAAKLLLAYEFGVSDPAYKGKKTTEEFDEKVKKAEENANKPGSVGGVKGGGAQTSEQRFTQMTDEQIEEHAKKVRFGRRK